MKKFIAISIIALSLSACNRAELDRLKSQNDSLQSMVELRDSSLSDMLSSFNDVERNLDSVAVKQHIIYQSSDQSGELKFSSKDRINAQIQGINDLMEKNRKQIADLNRRLKKSGTKNALLLKTIATLNAQLVQKEKELTDLNAQLVASNAQVAQLQTSVTTLTEQNTAQAETIVQTTTALHTAYYVVGKSKDLENSNVIDRKGGLLGIGKTSSLNSNFDNSKFTRIDYTQVNTIAINSKKVKIITSHPSDSYTLDTDASNKDMITNLVIKDAEKFWRASKYLVVIKD